MQSVSISNAELTIYCVYEHHLFPNVLQILFLYSSLCFLGDCFSDMIKKNICSFLFNVIFFTKYETDIYPFHQGYVGSLTLNNILLRLSVQTLQRLYLSFLLLQNLYALTKISCHRSSTKLLVILYSRVDDNFFLR